MRIGEKPQVQKTAFKASFTDTTIMLDKNMVVNRAIIDMFGCDIPWVIMANNKQERIERTIRYSVVFALAFLSPILTLPFSNRIAMKNFAKLTDSFFSNNHKAIHLSNEYLVNAEKMMEGLNELAKKTAASPIEKFVSLITKKPVTKQVLDVQDLIKRAGGEEELRQKLINNKNGVLCSDLIFSGFSLGSVNFVNNYLTEKRAGQKGYSAEFNMAQKEIIEKRASNYEKRKKITFASFAVFALTTSLAIPYAIKKGLSAVKPSKFADFIKAHPNLTNYKDGIYMSRFAMMMISIICHGGAILSARNKTETKDIAIRFGVADSIFYGGDLVLLAFFTRIANSLFGTQLLKEKTGKTSFIRKIFPEHKSIEEIVKLVDAGKLAKKNKYAAIGIFWTNMVLLTLAMGWGIPTILNKMIKKDVKKDIEKEGIEKISNTPCAPQNKTFEKFII